MKKLLLASTAIALSATLANAQALNITGEGRMGVIGTNDGSGWNWAQENRLQFNFNVSVEADHGLTFGAWSRARISNGGTAISNGPDGNSNPLASHADNADNVRGGFFSGSRVWVEANGFRLTFGNVDGAIRGAGTSHGYVGGCGIGYVGGDLCGDSVGLLAVTHGQSSTGGGHASMARIDYSAGNYRVALSHRRGGTSEIGVRASFGDFTVAGGYTGAAGGTGTLSGHYNGGSWGAGLIVARVGSTTNWALSGNTALGGGDLYGYVGRVSAARAYGLNYGYGLGGGATLTAGYERVGSDQHASVGVAFSF